VDANRNRTCRLLAEYGDDGSGEGFVVQEINMRFVVSENHVHGSAPSRNAVKREPHRVSLYDRTIITKQLAIDRKLSPVRKTFANLFSLKLISNSKQSDFENRTKTAGSRGRRESALSENNRVILPVGSPESNLEMAIDSRLIAKEEKTARPAMWGRECPLGGAPFRAGRHRPHRCSQRIARAIENGLIAAGISIAILAAVNGLGSNLNTMFGAINTSLK
jgi:pilus assembly protein Flp/PilA